MENEISKGSSFFERMSSVVTKATGSSAAFIVAFCVIIIWGLTGPVFGFSNGWQLLINTGTTITTFLMVFIIQRGQNKDSLAIHLKLNELIVAQEFASNHLVAVEDISEAELKVLHKFYKHLALMSKEEMTIEESHSINEAEMHHERTSSAIKGRRKKNKTKKINSVKKFEL